MKNRALRTLTLAVALASLAGTAACGSDGSAGRSAGPVTIEFWGWAPGYEKSVELFNSTHPDVKVVYSKISPGSKGGYTKLLSAVKAGNAPCVAMVGFETLPTFAAAGALQDVTPAAAPYAKEYASWAFAQSGVAGHTYGLPVDTAPMAFIYRKDLFAKYGIQQPPKTWDEYAADAAAIHAADPNAYIGYFGNDAYNFAGLAWQAGAKWFGTSGDKWTVNLADPATKKVAAFWQDLIDRKLVKVVPSFDTALYQGMGEGSILSDVNAVWDTPILADSVKQTAGNWAVAPMPVWDAATPAAGNAGGTPNAVLKGCKNPAQAVEFAHWFGTDPAGVGNLIKETGIYPAALSGLDNPALAEPNPFYGGQRVFDVFKDAATHVDPGFQWGPVMTRTSGALGDGLGKAGTGTTTLDAALADTQAQTLAEMKTQGMEAG
ncbi:multiple sugar transport system substrate-binding protein [Kitasatospora sp. SolWspMP-SS2h]|uniref:ABC transporter substrate-binding protein n=1 Tax=Kitasatospora sp. SolWspMP-SS2h TaxID=1305729 RepID=UPI000DB93696|nr:sugar ABC transporter substrate-binding protein [Kitasatospora sp. SolWspMP-SS2h]RAJ46335.1 multiple sugar transport system substrate-binding protein [Kitasatospora sp. SolWspMP-SS2h]